MLIIGIDIPPYNVICKTYHKYCTYLVHVHVSYLLGISQLFPDYTGTKLVFIDEKSDTFLYNPVTDALLEISGVTPSVTGLLWESFPDDKVHNIDTVSVLSQFNSNTCSV